MTSPISSCPAHTPFPKPWPRPPRVPPLQSRPRNGRARGRSPPAPAERSVPPQGPEPALCPLPPPSRRRRRIRGRLAHPVGRSGPSGIPKPSVRGRCPRDPGEPGAWEGRGLTQRQQRVAQQRGGRAALMVAHEGGVFAAQPARQQVLHREPGRVELGGREHEAHGQHQVGQREGDLGAVHRAEAQTRGEAATRHGEDKARASRSRRGRGARGALGDGVPTTGGRDPLWEVESPRSPARGRKP